MFSKWSGCRSITDSWKYTTAPKLPFCHQMELLVSWAQRTVYATACGEPCAFLFLSLLGHPPFSLLGHVGVVCWAQSQCGALGARKWWFYPSDNFSNAIRCQVYKMLYTRSSGNDFIQEFLVSSGNG
jgi:hypothetical protein